MDALKLLRQERARLKAQRGDSPTANPIISTSVPSPKVTVEEKEAETPQNQAIRWLSAVPHISLTLPPHLDLSRFRVGSIPNVYYVPDFISPEDAAIVLSCIRHEGLNDKWVHLRGRQLQNWGGIPPNTFDALPQWLQEVSSTLLSAGVFPPTSPPNHVLVNQYHPGQGIMAHTDGPAYMDPICIISMSGCVKFRFLPRNPDARTGAKVESLIVQPYSLQIFSDAACTDYLHEIPDDVEDVVDDTVVNCEVAGVSVGDVLLRKDTRYSITIRRALYPIDTDTGCVAAIHTLKDMTSSSVSSDGVSWESLVCGGSLKRRNVVGTITRLNDDERSLLAQLATCETMLCCKECFVFRFRLCDDAAVIDADTTTLIPGTIACRQCAVISRNITSEGSGSSGRDVVVVCASDVMSLCATELFELTLYQ